MGNKLRSPTQIGHLLLSDSSTDDYLYVQGIPIGDYPTITVAVAQIIGVGNDAYTTAQYIRFTPTTEQAAILANNDYTIIKLDLTALGNSAPAPYVWLRRNTVIALPNPLDPSSTIPAYQFTCGGEQFWYENYQTDIAIKNIGNAALVYVPQLILDPVLTPYGVADITLLNISVPTLYSSIQAAKDNVKANPAGAASGDITKIEIGGTVYDIPSGGNAHLYQHNVACYNQGSTFQGTITIVSTEANAYTSLQFNQAALDKIVSVSGVSSNSDCFVVGVGVNYIDTYLVSTSILVQDTSFSLMLDTVKQLF